MAMETWMRAPIYGSLVLLLSHCGLEQASQSQSVPKNQGKTQVKMGDTLAVSQPTEPPKVSENLVAAKPEEPPKVSEKPDAKADCLRRFSADRLLGIGIGNGLTVGIGNGLTGWTPEIKMCTAGQNAEAPYVKCGIPVPSIFHNRIYNAAMSPCVDQESGYRLGTPFIYSGAEIF